MRLFRKIPVFQNPLLMALGLTFILASAISNIEAKIPGDATYVGSESCTDCHDVIGEEFVYNVHRVSMAKSDEVDNISCESCHGPGSAHIETADPEMIYSFSRDYGVDSKSPCVDCHRGYPKAGFGDDHHPMTDGGCSDCHVAHSDEPMLVKKKGEALCFECHLETMAQFRMPSHHPVREGFLECSDCHSVHGKKQAQFVGIDDREECLGCHTEKQGPFIFEHEPVNEDCKICHNPHGSVANNLLKQAEPFVCLSCHPMHFHTAITGLDSDFSAPLYPGLGGTSTKDAFKKAMLTKCTQCHSQVHGSDLPSQGITSLGQGLTR